MLLLALLAFLQGTPAQSPPAQSPPAQLNGVRSGITVAPETLTVGDAFIVRVRVAAPRGSTIQFPASADSGAATEQVDPRAVANNENANETDQTAAYRLVVWDTGAVKAHFGDIVVRLGDAERRVAVGDVRVYVQSVLPADTSLRVPKPARDIVLAERPWWWWWPWALAGLITLLLLWLLWWLLRRRRRKGEPALDPYSEAEREFARIDSLGLVEAGERGRFVALNVEVLRDYLAARTPFAPRSLTSTELVHAWPAHGPLPVERLVPVLAEADLIKFARRPVTADRAKSLAGETRAIVDDVEERVRAEEEAAKQREEAARAAREKTEPREPERAA